MVYYVISNVQSLSFGDLLYSKARENQVLLKSEGLFLRFFLYATIQVIVTFLEFNCKISYIYNLSKPFLP